MDTQHLRNHCGRFVAVYRFMYMYTTDEHDVATEVNRFVLCKGNKNICR